MAQGFVKDDRELFILTLQGNKKHSVDEQTASKAEAN
jgi:hypothetical protein